MTQKEKIVIGIDLGGTGIRIAGIDSRGNIYSENKEIILQSRMKDYVIDQLVEGINDVLIKYGSGVEVIGIGLGVPGFIIENSIVFSSPNFPDWRMVDIRKILESKLGMKIILENDANAAAYGEFWGGAGKGCNNMIYIGLGTGVGGGVILNKKIWYGSNGVAGEIGHISVNPEGPRCGCGNSGCIESYASATALVNNYIKKCRSGLLTSINAKEIYNKAKQGDQLAMNLFQDMGRYLGIGISSIINLLNPDVVVIGGRVNTSWDLFVDPMMEEITRRGIKPSIKDLKIIPSLLQDKSGLVGAAGIVWDSIGLREE